MDVDVLHGPASAGKYTVGRRLAQRLGWPLFHNHLAVDAAQALFELGSPGFVELRAAIWRSAFHAAAAAGRSFVFGFHPERAVRVSLSDELAGCVGASGGRIHFVKLVCDRQTVLERLADPGRAAFGKLTDPALYVRLEVDGSFEFPPLPTALLTIDTARSTADASAARIAAALQAAAE